MSKHTPGPWTVTVKGQFSNTFVEYRIEQPKRTRSEAESQANARLIAASPEMLDALKEALPCLENAEYRLRVNDWAEGDPNECDDSKEGRDAIKAYKQTLKAVQQGIQKVRGAIERAEMVK